MVFLDAGSFEVRSVIIKNLPTTVLLVTMLLTSKATLTTKTNASMLDSTHENCESTVQLAEKEWTVNNDKNLQIT